MTNPNDVAKPTGKASPPSAAGRYLFLFLLGLVVGVVAVVMVMRALEQRKSWQDHYPDAAMHLMQAHVAQMGAATSANRCSPTDTIPHLRSLRTIANDIEPAMPDLKDDARFVSHAGKLRATLDAALSEPPLDCPGVGNVAEKIGEACKACHQDYRG